MKAALVGLYLLGGVPLSTSSFAFDIKSGVTKDSGPFDLFKFGFNAYKKGQKQDAVEAFRYAAEKGHTGSRWALANMYADGDGVAKSDYEAFKMYNQIASQGIEPGSADTGFFVNAMMALAGYYRTGIDNSPVQQDLPQARQIYFQMASAFGIADAQFQLGRMMLEGEGGNRNVDQAKKWLNRARKTGHAGATGVFGSVIFQEGQSARGLAFMTQALDHCQPKDCGWLQELQEQAFSVASEDDRRAAVALVRQGDIPVDVGGAPASGPTELSATASANRTVQIVPVKPGNGFVGFLSKIFKRGDETAEKAPDSATSFQSLNAASVSQPK